MRFECPSCGRATVSSLPLPECPCCGVRNRNSSNAFGDEPAVSPSADAAWLWALGACCLLTLLLYGVGQMLG